MPIKISKTYETWDQESLEIGETNERGFEYEDADYEFRELVYELKNGGYIYPSCSHGTPKWVSTEPDLDYRTGEETTYSLHPGRDPMSQKYWAKACRAAGVN